MSNSGNENLFIQQPVHVELDLSSARRVFVFGDIHGYLGNIEKAMRKVGYDAAAGDRMIGLGDWLDRGEETLEIGYFIEDHQDDLVFVKGNHEQMLEDAFVPGPNAMDPGMLIRNGGSWVLGIMDEEELENDRIVATPEGRRLLKAVCGAPIAITATMPSGSKVGFVHAEVRRILEMLDWNVFTGVLEQQGEQGGIAQEAIWARTEYKNLDKIKVAMGAKAPTSEYVANIDHVFHGHTIVKDVMTWGNRSWIDIGSYANSKIAFIDVEKHLKAQK